MTTSGPDLTSDGTAAPPSPGPGPDPAMLSFDDALAELQRTVAALETGGQPLELSIAMYERGVALHERCAGLLADAELRLHRLVERAGGALEAVPLRAEEAVDAPRG